MCESEEIERKAKAFLKEYGDESQYSHAVRSMLCKMYFLTRQHELAMVEASHCLQQQPDDAEILFIRSHIYFTSD